MKEKRENDEAISCYIYLGSGSKEEIVNESVAYTGTRCENEKQK
jgi:hypothetical protein